MSNGSLRGRIPGPRGRHLHRGRDTIQPHGFATGSRCIAQVTVSVAGTEAGFATGSGAHAGLVFRCGPLHRRKIGGAAWAWDGRRGESGGGRRIPNAAGRSAKGAGRDADKNLPPFAIVATAGTTDFGSVDPLAKIAVLAQSAGVWLHLDAAYGGALLFSHRHRAKLEGVAAADSMGIDFHKLFGSPSRPALSCCATLVTSSSSNSTLTT